MLDSKASLPGCLRGVAGIELSGVQVRARAIYFGLLCIVGPRCGRSFEVLKTRQIVYIGRNIRYITPIGTTSILCKSILYLLPNLDHQFLPANLILSQKVESVLDPCEEIGMVEQSDAIGLEADADELRKEDWDQGIGESLVLR